ncbi:MAG: type III pantothenate kinase [Lentisphaerae bacterium]|nr:type III pantothenate kinase [Lentisphaerota bacterium]
MNCMVVDVGNTSTSLGLAQGARITRVARLPGKLRDVAAIERAIRRAGDGKRLDGAVLASVVPAVNRVWLGCLKRATGHPALLVSHRVALGVDVDYPRPESIGADRLANAAGAVARYGAPVIVADFGTAVTFDVVSKDGAYIGGVIGPGLPLMTDYLAERTALLPRITLTGRCGVIGRSTTGAMRIGAHIGYRGMVREITAHLLQRHDLRRARLCATGGYARWALAGAGLPFQIDPDLTLFGLSRIFELNAGRPE